MLDDIRFIDDATRDAFTAVFADFGGNTNADTFVITGCVVSGLSHSAGWMFHLGEIVKVDAGTLPTLSVGEQHCWTLQESSDSAGTKVFQSQVTIDTYYVRRMVASATSASSGFVPLHPPRYNELLMARISAVAAEAWHVINDPGEPVFLNGWSSVVGAHKPQFYTDHFGVTALRGITQHSLPSFPVVMWTLPYGTPAGVTLEFLVPCKDAVSGDKNVLRVSIKPNGDVTAEGMQFASPAVTSSVQVNLGEIRFRR